jgi:hypothetical protein
MEEEGVWILITAGSEAILVIHFWIDSTVRASGVLGLVSSVLMKVSSDSTLIRPRIEQA